MSKTSSSSQSTSYVTSQGAGASASTTSGDSTLLQEAIFTPGATSASASSADGTVSVAVSAPTVADGDSWFLEEFPNPVFHIGSPLSDRFQATDQQDVMTGYAGADIFSLSVDIRETTSADIADIIIDFDLNEDSLQLPAEITVDDLHFEVTDIDADTVAESTVIRLGENGDILAVVLNRILPIANLQNPVIDSGTSVSSQSSSKSFVTDAGAGTITEATATSPDGETVRSVDSLFVPGATSSGGKASAIATPEQATVNLVVPIQHPVLGADLFETTGGPADFIIGTAMADILVSDDGRDILVGYGSADTFVLDPVGTDHFADADLIIDFNLEAGDLIQLSSELSSGETIVLEGVDLDNNLIPESTSIRLTNGNILAIAYGTVDLIANPLLAAEMFTTVV